MSENPSGNNPIIDNVSGISWNTMYRNFGGADDNPTQYRDRLIAKYPEKATAIKELFSQYSY